jgi:hypothetical protein
VGGGRGNARRAGRYLRDGLLAWLCLAAISGGLLAAAARGASFEPSLALDTASAADSPSGLHLALGLAGVGEPGAELSRIALTLPPGFALDLSFANRHQGCSAAQVGLTSAPGATPVEFAPSRPECPDASRLGTIEVEPTDFGHPLTGVVYLASQGQNPFGSLLALYVVVEEPMAAVFVKLAGNLAVDARTDQLVASFEELPQVGLRRVRVDLRGGPEALLTTPPTCGEYTAQAQLESAEGGTAADLPAQLDLSEGPDGSPCASIESEQPNQPGFAAGTLSPAAGAYSPFLLQLHRENGSQRIAALNVALPPGLLGRLAGIIECADTQIGATEARSGEGEGALEQRSPSCPVSSEVGTITVGVGSGAPFQAHGHVYLAGPYRGAPLSVVAITPAIAGPFDLGVAVDRVATYVNPETAQVNPVTETIPRVLHGIPLDIRSIAVDLDRGQFIFNPTNCGPMTVTGQSTSTLGQLAFLDSPFQAVGCAELPFRPRLALRLRGPTRRNRFPALTATLTARPQEANSASARVILPHSEFIEQGHIRTVCTRVQFANRECPAASVYGHARVITPLLEFPEEGPVYLRSSSHGLPDLLVALRGPAFQPIEIDLDGRTDAVHARIRTTFKALPDAPILRFTLSMEGGKKGLLVNSENLCSPSARTRAVIDLTGQNGKRYDTTPVVRNSCHRASPRSGGRAQ